jgi:hypothetical protein
MIQNVKCFLIPLAKPRSQPMAESRPKAWRTNYRLWNLRGGKLNISPLEFETLNLARAGAAERAAQTGLPVRFLRWTEDPSLAMGDDCHIVAETRWALHLGRVVHTEI